MKKKLPCKNPECGNRRIHYERQDEPRGTQYIEVSEGTTENDPVFCSITCACMDGWMTVKYETQEQIHARHRAWRLKEEKRANDH